MTGGPAHPYERNAMTRAEYIAALWRERAVYVRQQLPDRVADVDRELQAMGEPVLVETAATIAPETATLPKSRRKAAQ